MPRDVLGADTSSGGGGGASLDMVVGIIEQDGTIRAGEGFTVTIPLAGAFDIVLHEPAPNHISVNAVAEWEPTEWKTFSQVRPMDPPTTAFRVILFDPDTGQNVEKPIHFQAVRL